ncbi:MAG: TMEM165/GDT1 family protein [Syntrophomonadaceae bacterium]|nr:TMEM165/GDT1 family protein [Syntrophomonadaceae bacterium]MDD3889390.1 TMEM165/GDT1 family protein [Syntrophomonadaceae bacterium]MDD4548455.1 TMEM165/GDT1 family protein [Syntrophomonadaceae bacterium]
MSTKLVTLLTTYLVIILCELGDKTQVAVLLFTSNNPGKRWTIFAASALALTLCVIVEVTVGVTLARYIGPALINKCAGLIFLSLGIFTLLKTFNLGEKIGVKRRGEACAEQTH